MSVFVQECQCVIPRVHNSVANNRVESRFQKSESRLYAVNSENSLYSSENEKSMRSQKSNLKERFTSREINLKSDIQYPENILKYNTPMYCKRAEKDIRSHRKLS